MPRVYDSAAFKERYRTDPEFRAAQLAKSKVAYEKGGRERRQKKHQANREEILARDAERYRQIRETAVAIYGGQCVNCGATDRPELDHVNGGGREHRLRESHRALYKRIAQLGGRLPDVELQILCHFCHRYKGRDAEQVKASIDRILAQLFTAEEYLRRNQMR